MPAAGATGRAPFPGVTSPLEHQNGILLPGIRANPRRIRVNFRATTVSLDYSFLAYREKQDPSFFHPFFFFFFPVPSRDQTAETHDSREHGFVASMPGFMGGNDVGGN